MEIEKLSGEIIEGKHGGGYKQYETLTATEFNKVPRKINEVVDAINNISALDDIDIEELVHINERVNNVSENVENNSSRITNVETSINDIRTDMEELNVSLTPNDISNSSITNIDSQSTIKLEIDAFGKLALKKIDDISIVMTVNPSSLEIDQVLYEPILIHITVLNGENEITSLTLETTSGTLTKVDNYNWKLSNIDENTDTTVTARVNNKIWKTTVIKYNITRSGYLWSNNELSINNFKRPENMTKRGFYLMPGLINNEDINQNYWESQSSGSLKYFYIVTSTKVNPEDIRQRFFLYRSDIPGGMIYVGEIKEYSNDIPYYVYRTKDKVDTAISVEIKMI